MDFLGANRARGSRRRSGVPWRCRFAFAVAGAVFFLARARPAEADFRFKKGSFTKETAAAPVSQPISGLGFQPKAVIFFWTRQDAEGLLANIRSGYGFASSPSNESAIAFASNNGVAVFAAVTGRWQSLTSSILILNDGAPSLVAEAEITSFDADGFTLDWITNEPRADIIHYVALGGSDLTNAIAGSFQKTLGPGIQTVTGVGFQPEFVMFLSANAATVGAPGDPHGKANLGFAASPSSRASMGVLLEDATLIRNTWVYARSDRAFVELNNSGGEETRIELASFDPDGFTLNKEVNTASGQYIHYLALRGGRYRVGNFLKTSAFPGPTTQSVSGVGFQPTGLIAMSRSANGAPPGVPENEGRISFGAADGVSQGATWWHDDNGANPVEAFERTTTSELVVLSFQSSAPYAPGSFNTFNPDGFTLDWNPNSATTDEVVYVAFAPEQINFRSIGTRPNYGTAEVEGPGTTVTATNGSAVVTGSGTAWQTFNRGRGDRIWIDGIDHTVRTVDSQTQLTLTAPFTGTTGFGKAYLIARQYSTLQDWEDCISGVPAACTFFPVSSASLVADDRREVGIAYKDSTFGLTADVIIDGSTTDATHTITLTADPGNRHNGAPGAGVIVDGQNAPNRMGVEDDNVTIEWLEFIRIRGASQFRSLQVGVSTAPGHTNILLQNLLVHDFFDASFNVRGIGLSGTGGHMVTIRNCMIWDGDQTGIEADEATDQLTIENCSIDNMAQPVDGAGIHADLSTVTVKNTIATRNAGGDFFVGGGGFSAASSNNTSSDGTAPGTNPQTSVLASDVFVTPGTDLHLKAGVNPAVDTGLTLTPSFWNDIDGQSRIGLTWDRGADERDATTAVELVSFEALARDAAVALSWQTASELDNLGFHLYRATSAEGPYERITSRLIPGLGSSPVGARYSYLDSRLVNGVAYFYKLEDIETTGRREMHGPVSAAPSAETAAPGGISPGVHSREGAAVITYGRPEATELRVLERGRDRVVLELLTGGFFAIPAEDGSVSVEIPGFETIESSEAPSLPLKRAWVEAVAGRKVKLLSIRALEVEALGGLVPSSGGDSELEARHDGTVRVARRRGPARSAAFHGTGLFPGEAARLLSVGFQGEVKKAFVEMAPLRWDANTSQLHFARRLRVVLSFRERDLSEVTEDGFRGRRFGREVSRQTRGVVARLATREKGLYSVTFEQAVGRGPSYAASSLRLSRLGEERAFFLQPKPQRFGPGSTLFFVGEGADANPYGHEVVFELEVGVSGQRMAEVTSRPLGEEVSFYWKELSLEQNRYYQAALLEAPDLWLWEVLLAPVKKSFAFTVYGVAEVTQPASLKLWLQGASDFHASPDHHLRVFLNGAFLLETSWEGKRAHQVEISIPAGVLREGENSLELENVGDTGADYSMFFLDRFELVYPKRLEIEHGSLQGRSGGSGWVEIRGSYFLDVTERQPLWLKGEATGAGTSRFGVEAGRAYLAAAEALGPEVRRPASDTLKSPHQRADYLLIAPKAFLESARPLRDRRRSQGLRVKSISMESVYSEFGFGEARPEALRDFLYYAYHQWKKPSPRYVLLLGDASYDFKDYLGTGVGNRVPALAVKTSYLWTASDPALASVNGDDPLPDLAIGRLPAATVEEARHMVEKTVSWETAVSTLRGTAVLVADNPDAAGDFEADAEAVASGVLSGRPVRKIYLAEQGSAATREAVLQAFDQGASSVSYVGHGGIHLWASENVFDTAAVSSLSSQAEQPLVLTMNCLNGYFHFPYFNALSEEVVKAEGRGAVAAFSPSGLSLNDAAHQYHQAILRELFRGGHARLGDALLAAQATYAATGAFPELLQIYHLFGDPGLKLR